MAKSKTKLNYAPAPESGLSKLPAKFGNYIGGKFLAPKSGKYFNTINPANQVVLTKISKSSIKDVDFAVRAAEKAYQGAWSSLSGSKRGQYLFRIARLIQERSKELAILETMDGGKPIKEARDIDLPLVAQHFFYYAGWADKLEYAVPGRKVQSIGVCGQIIPWNFPLLMLAWKVAPALAAGNTVVLKPAEQTSLTALKFAEICQEAGLPAGVVNIITGEGDVGAAIVRHPKIKKIAFTGSTTVGKEIAANCGDKKLTLELGGKSANIIFADAAIDQAVEGIIQAIFFNQGHVCSAGSRLLLEESVAPTIIRKLKRRMKKIRVGDPMDKNTDLGAINSKDQLKKIQKMIKQGKLEGGDFWQVDQELPPKGNYISPCFFINQAASSTITREEIFGPVLSISTFRTPDEAILKANDSTFGLAAGIWSEKGSKIQAVAKELRAGVVWANSFNRFDAASPFGGFKESGFGREGGWQGLLPYLEVK